MAEVRAEGAHAPFVQVGARLRLAAQVGAYGRRSAGLLLGEDI